MCYVYIAYVCVVYVCVVYVACVVVVGCFMEADKDEVHHETVLGF